MTQSGWRKPTPGLCKATALAKNGEGVAVPKNQAILAVRRVAPVIGLKPSDVLLLDTLAVFTKPCDWEEGHRPIVWPSNDYLIEATGLSLSAIKRHLRKLAEVGLIAFKDSSNGKRWGRRDNEGRIVEAYGFDLSPLAVRVGEFEALFASIREERDLCKALKRKITILRRTVHALLESVLEWAVGGAWWCLRQRYETLLVALARGRKTVDALLHLHDAFSALTSDAEGVFKAAGAEVGDDAEAESKHCVSREKFQEVDPSEAHSGPYIPITTHLQTVIRNRIEKEEAGRLQEREPAVAFAATNLGDLDREPEGKTRPLNAAPGRAESEFTLQSILYACPVFAEMAHGIGGHIRNWRDFTAAAVRIRLMIGISVDAWGTAQAALGTQEAAAAVALITDKLSEGVISSPGGYLRGLTSKAQRGELYLARSIYGRMSERQNRAGAL